MVVKKISTNLLMLSHNANLKFHVGLFDNEEQKPRDVIYTYNDEYVTININSFVTLEIKDRGGEEWDPSKSIMITQLNIYELIKSLQQVVDSIYKKDTFEIVNGVTKISAESIVENTVVAAVGKNTIKIHPAVIYDPQEDNFYEGAVMYLNKNTNCIEMHYTRLEALLYKLKQIDFTIYALQIFTFYMKNGELKEFMAKPKANTKRKVNVFDEPKDIKAGGNLPVGKPSMDSFF